ncbi:hypothetical protein PYW07_008458 [Mythimna separata]|uniref:Uncharacterized protein n=1 Tax=Mythimna separata TaxID=271217 RepID=A0AAD7YD72_MYTSE|nr:hypothetical protein PYW07_008458 [Mythimna separata]
MKYLGLVVLHSRWTFEEHFRRLAPKLDRTGAALKRLLPNLGGPDDPCRRLYVGIVRSMALYGASVWPAAKLNPCQRVMVIRMVQGYRTISLPPLGIWRQQSLHDLRVEMQRRGETPLHDKSRYGGQSSGGISGWHGDSHCCNPVLDTPSLRW